MLAALCAMAVLVPAADAGSRFGPRVTIFPPGSNGDRAQVALTPRGDALALTWSEKIEGRLRLASSLGRGAFGHRRFFTERIPWLISGRADQILALVSRDVGDDEEIAVRTGSVTGPFGRGEPVDRETNQFVDPAIFTTGPTGDVFLVWTTSSVFCACLDRLHVRVRAAGEQKFGPTRTLSPPNRRAFLPHLAFDRNGDALLTWSQEADIYRGRLGYALRPVGAARFGAPHTLPAGSPHGGVTGLDLASNGAGRAVAVWSAHAEPFRDVRAAIGTVTGGFHSVEPVADGRASEPHVAVDRSGEAVATWADPSATLAAAPPGRGFGEPQRLESGKANSPVVAADGAGTFTATWRRFPSRALHAVRRKAGSTRRPRVVELWPGRVWRSTLAVTARHETLLGWVLLDREASGRGMEVALRGARVALGRPHRAFGHPLDLRTGSWGRGFPYDRLYIAVDGVGGAFVWWRHVIEGRGTGHYGRFLLPP